MTDDDVKIYLNNVEKLKDIKGDAKIISGEGKYQSDVTAQKYYYGGYNSSGFDTVSYEKGSLYKISIGAGEAYWFDTDGYKTFYDENFERNTSLSRSALFNGSDSAKDYYIWVVPSDSSDSTSIDVEKMKAFDECISEAVDLPVGEQIQYSGDSEKKIKFYLNQDGIVKFYNGILYKAEGGSYGASVTDNNYNYNMFNTLELSAYDENLNYITNVALNTGDENRIDTPFGKNVYMILNVDNECKITFTKKSTKIEENTDKAIELSLGENVTNTDGRDSYQYVSQEENGEKIYSILEQCKLYKYTVPAKTKMVVNIPKINDYERAGNILAFDDVADTCFQSYNLWNGEKEFSYENLSDNPKTIYLLFGGSWYINDGTKIIIKQEDITDTPLESGGNWNNDSYVIDVDDTKQIKLADLTDKGFEIDSLIEVTDNGTYDADKGIITVQDIDKVVKYTYDVDGVKKSLQFVPYQKSDEEFKEAVTVKVEESTEKDKVNGGETKVSLEVTQDGEVTGKIAETTIPVSEDKDAAVIVTEKKDSDGEVVKDASIEVTQNTISNDALEKSLDVLENKNKEYKSNGEGNVSISTVSASFKDDTGSTSIDGKIFDRLKDEGAVLEISKVDDKGRVGYTWTFRGENIKNVEAAINVKISVYGKEDNYQDRTLLNQLTKAQADNCVLSFAHSGVLPGKTDVSVDVSAEYKEGQSLKYYYFNKKENKLEYCGDTIVKDGFVVLRLEHCSDYVLSDEVLATTDTTEKPTATDTTEKPAAAESTVTPETTTAAPSVNVSYKSHIQTSGWEQTWNTNGEISGTTGESKRLEAIDIKVNGNDNLGIQYTTHCQSYGWLPWVANGEMSGTEGESKRIEAIKIQLTGSDKNLYDVYYRVHVQNYGWLGWAKNGEAAGTVGQARRLEGIQIIVVKKGESINTSMGNITSAWNAASISLTGSSIEVAGADTPNVIYRSHVQTYGWQDWKYNGQMSGTIGESRRLEGIEIKLSNCPYSGGITYQTHIQNSGWTDEWSSNGQISGTIAESKRVEAIAIKLTGEMNEYYDVYYRAHVQNYGWLDWAKNGEASGTSGLSKRLEGIQIVLVPKGSAAPSSSYGGVTSTNSTAYISK